MRKNIRGITLIALIVTIIILLILATIVISELKNTKLFNKTIEARDKSKQAEANEANILDNYANKINEIAGGVVTRNNPAKIVDNTPPEITISQKSVTINSISVSATATDAESGMPENPTFYFYIKKASNSNYPTTPSYTGSGSSPIFNATNLSSGTEYNIMVKVSNNAGLENSNSISLKTNVDTSTINFSSSLWTITNCEYNGSINLTGTNFVGSGNGAYTYKRIDSKNTYDLTEYKNMKCSINISDKGTWGYGTSICIASENDSNNWVTLWSSENSTNTTLTLDISGYTGNYIIMIQGAMCGTITPLQLTQ